jgi:hypothetical protein
MYKSGFVPFPAMRGKCCVYSFSLVVLQRIS